MRLGRSGVEVRVISQGWSRLAVAAAMMAAFALAGCGRKGPLDPPPNASLPPSPQQQQSYNAQPSLGEDTTFQPPGGARPPRAQAAASPATPPPPPQPFILDFLIGK